MLFQTKKVIYRIGNIVGEIPNTTNFVIFLVLVVGLLTLPAYPALAKKSAADEQFFLQALKTCRFRETNFTFVRVNYDKRTFKCYGDNYRKRKKKK
jgi:hypothetical protein